MKTATCHSHVLPCLLRSARPDSCLHYCAACFVLTRFVFCPCCVYSGEVKYCIAKLFSGDVKYATAADY